MNTPRCDHPLAKDLLLWKPLALAISITFTPVSALAAEMFVPLRGANHPLEDDSDGHAYKPHQNPAPYRVIDGHAVTQGDMVIGKIDAEGNLESTLGTRGLGQNQVFDRWENGVITYELSDRLSSKERQNALDAVDHWNQNTTISIVPRDSSNEDLYSDFLMFEPSLGCASWVGRTGKGEQSIWISESCTVGSVIHEIGHAVGLFHEHTRDDRDSFITVNWDNIVEGKTFNFDLMQAGAEKLGDYDYGSIMHYGAYFFTKNNLVTITAPEGIQIGQRDALSAKDIRSANDLYATDVALQFNYVTENDSTQFDFAIDNLGELGAHELELVLNLGSDSEWVSISPDSGWDCLSFDTELRCKRTTLAAAESSQFSIAAELGSASAGDLQARVQMNTKDSNTANNAYNDAVVVASNGGTLEEEATPANASSAPSEEPMIQSANGGTSGGASGDEDGGGGGSTGHWLLGIALGSMALRRRRLALK